MKKSKRIRKRNDIKLIVRSLYKLISNVVVIFCIFFCFNLNIRNQSICYLFEDKYILNININIKKSNIKT